MQRCLAFKSSFVSSRGAQLGVSGVRPARASCRMVVQAKRAEAGVGIFGTKAGMMTYFTEDGLCVPATVIALEEGNMVTAVKSKATDGYDAVQVGYKVVKEKNFKKPELGHLKKSGCPPLRHLREFKVNDASKVANLQPGQQLDIAEMFKAGDAVDVAGTTVGKGFQGTIKRWHHKRGLMTHGSKSHREHGSTGPGTTPGRTYPGLKMAGHMGNVRRKSKQLHILKVVKREDRPDSDFGLLVVKGSVPGKAGNVLEITPAKIVGKNC